LKKKVWCIDSLPKVMGIDPGFATTGVAILQGTSDGSEVRCLGLKLIETKKTPKKLMRDLRVSADDYQRLRQIHYEMRTVIMEHEPAAIAYEVYQPFTGPVKGRTGYRSSSWKVGRVEGVIVSIGTIHELLILPFLTLDLKKGLTGNRSASKAQVQEALHAKVSGFTQALLRISKTKKEHVSDAVGYAYLAYQEMCRMRQMMGVS
jgi:Holliday junction resolvasome RuvABC endonuclease subunit